MTRARVAVVGGGLVGLATAYAVLRTRPDATVTVLEKESGVGRHQSTHNSGVLHAGLSYAPGSLKARLATDGIAQMVAFCEAHDIPHEICGKVVVASAPHEVPMLHAVLERGKRNGLTGLTWLSPDALREIEPHARGVAAVRVPQEGIVSYARVVETLASCIAACGGRVMTNAGVLGIRRRGNARATGWVLQSAAGDVEADVLINCAGLHSDRVATMAGEHPAVRIVPFRGEYYALRAERQGLVRHLVYPVPDPAFPFLGVHFTRLVSGGVIAGPSAMLALAREGYRASTMLLRDVAETCAFPGVWRFLARYPAMCWAELRQSMSRELFAAALRRLVPELRTDDLTPAVAGVRAQAMRPTGELVQDFELLERPGALHVINAPSPGATASLAIGGEIVRRLSAQLV
ncbi:MAG TPA: L-2-hydroxyglutarate oxidase [Gemmatimonadaceae bacterium]|nr:L-2-hydroxyglutarate oxidase [Gemmatimonadaceae bacterium]